MIAALFHPGDLGLSGLLLMLLILVGVPALVILALGYAVYKGLSAKTGAFTTINLEGRLEPDDKHGGGADRAGLHAEGRRG
jgi:hypothetical protein